MSWSMASAPPPRGAPPATLESRALFRVQAAAVVERAAPIIPDPNVVVVTFADGEMRAYTPSDKLTILADVRQRRLVPKPTPKGAA